LDDDEDDGYDETIYPMDHASYPNESGQIVDDVSIVYVLAEIGHKEISLVY
jgi:hypothetical protein